MPSVQKQRCSWVLEREAGGSRISRLLACAFGFIEVGPSLNEDTEGGPGLVRWWLRNL